MISSVSNLDTTAVATGTAVKNPKLEQAAHDFESMMMSELLKPLQHDSLFSENGDDDSASGSGNALSQFASESLGRALSAHGGLGIGKKVLDQLNLQSAGKSGQSETNISPLNSANS